MHLNAVRRAGESETTGGGPADQDSGRCPGIKSGSIWLIARKVGTGALKPGGGAPPARLAQGGQEMPGNKTVVYQGPGHVTVENLEYPKLEHPVDKRQLRHAAILKVTSTNICGSDQHMVRGRTTAPEGQTLGHEITGEVIETGNDVQFIKEGDLCSVPFNIACGRCRACKERMTGICLNVNPDRPGSAYGYVDMGGWVGGQANYVLVPYADWNLLKFPDKDQAMEKILDLTMLSDIFPTGYHGCV